MDLFLLETRRFNSRQQIQRLIRNGLVKVDGTPAKPACRLKPLQAVHVRVPPAEPAESEPDAIPLQVLYEDADILVVDKPAGMVVHPAAGHRRNTLVNALLHHCRDLSGIGGALRPGIVHRIDKGTSGLLVVAKNDPSHLALCRQFQKHSILREYVGLVHGGPDGDAGVVRAPIGRHPKDRKRMATLSNRGRAAVTHWRVERRYSGCSLMRFTLETGRTHQIRVHMKELGCPIVGDAVYAARKERQAEAGTGGSRGRALPKLTRPFLHAEKLGFLHPGNGRFLQFSAPLPEELRNALRVLERRGNP